MSCLSSRGPRLYPFWVTCMCSLLDCTVSLKRVTCIRFFFRTDKVVSLSGCLCLPLGWLYTWKWIFVLGLFPVKKMYSFLMYYLALRTVGCILKKIYLCLIFLQDGRGCILFRLLVLFARLHCIPDMGYLCPVFLRDDQGCIPFKLLVLAARLEYYLLRLELHWRRSRLYPFHFRVTCARRQVGLYPWKRVTSVESMSRQTYRIP